MIIFSQSFGYIRFVGELCVKNYAKVFDLIQLQCTMGCAADESGMEGGFSAP
jgi:hypothetical protein